VADSVELDFDEVLGETDAAYHLDVGDGPLWVPKSVVVGIDESAGVADIKYSWAYENGLV